MSRAYSGVAPKKRRFSTGGVTSLPVGTQLIPVEVKKEFDTIPFHVYHPNPHDAITILRSKRSPHDWLVCGWYVDTLREGGSVKGLIYREVTSEPDKEFIRAELKKHDKEALPRFSL